MKQKKFLRSLLALFLCVSLLAPAWVFAAESSSLPQLSEDEVPAILDVEEMRAKGHVKRMYGEETKLNEVIFLNTDGSRTAYLFGEAVKYEDEEGKTKDKSYKIKTKDTVYENEDNDLVITYSRELKNGIRFRQGAWQVEIVPLEIDKNVKSKVVNQSKKHRNDFVEYKKAFGNHTVLKYVQELNGFKEEIVLEKEVEANRFSFRYLTYGATLSLEGKTAQLKKGKMTLDLGEILLWDSAGNRGLGQYELQTVRENEEYVLTLNASEFLSRSDLQYPVTVDPSFYLDSDYSWSEAYIEDTVIYTDYPYSEFGNESYLRVGNYDVLDESEKDYTESGADIVEEKGIGRALFRLPNLFTENEEYYEDYVLSYWMETNYVRSINLNLYVTSNAPFNNGPETYLEAYMLPVGATWEENDAVYSSAFDQPVRKMDLQHISRGSSTSSQWIGMDITYAVSAWYRGEYNNGIQITSSDSINRPVNIHTKETYSSAYRPYVTLEYEMNYDAMVFRLKHVASGRYATMVNAEAINNQQIQLGATAPQYYSTSESSYQYRTQLFRFNKALGQSWYYINPVCSGNGYQGRVDVIQQDGSPIAEGMNVRLLLGADPAQQFLITLNSDGTYTISLNDSSNCKLGVASGAQGARLQMRSPDENQSWILEPAYDFMQIENYYSSLGFSFFYANSSRTINGITISGAIGEINSSYGYREMGIHCGVDFKGTGGTPLFAPFDCWVQAAGRSGNEGNRVALVATNPKMVSFDQRTSLGVIYMHMTSIFVSYGQTISAGTSVGTVGATGLPDENKGHHLHMGVYLYLNNFQYALDKTLDALMFYGKANPVAPARWENVLQ